MRIELDCPILLSELSEPCIGLNVRDFEARTVTTDSREVRRGDLFISLSDSESHVEQARKRGALTAGEESADITISGRKLLSRLAEYKRTQLMCLKASIAVTGSVGKTTTKDILSAMLGGFFKVHATHENYNNELGVAYTLLSAPSNTEILICELGMNHRGEISTLSRTVKPTLGLITNIGTAHIGNLGSRAEIAKAKLEIADGMEKPFLIIPHGEPLLTTQLPHRSFGTEPSADVCAYKAFDDGRGMRVNIVTPTRKLEGIYIDACGEHILKAAAAAVCAAELSGLDTRKIREGLSRVHGGSRGEYIRLGDITVYDDTYSSSYEAVVNMLNIHSGTRALSCVLGDMLELGEHGERLHEKAAAEAVRHGVKRLYTFGKYSEALLRGALSLGMKRECIFINTDTDAPEITARAIYDNSSSGETVLIKASHALKAHRITEALRELYRNTEDNDA